MAVSVNPPKTPITTGSNAVAAATMPNVCKMPGPPAPFVPTPLPNIARSSLSPKDFSKKVKIEGKPVGVRGSSFASTGDVASKGTGGGVVSANTHGPIKFVGPGSMNVKVEGKNVQLLGDPVLNNCGPSGSPPNSATMAGVLQATGRFTVVEEGECPVCGEEHQAFEETEATKADAGALAQSFRNTLEAARATWKSKKKKSVVQTMLGVARCRCDVKYADQSSATTIELCRAASAAGMRHLDGVTASLGQSKQDHDDADIIRVRAAMERICGGVSAFHTNMQLAEYRAARSLDPKVDSLTAYPPGSCAAQSVLVLLHDDGGLPSAMTEELFSSNPAAQGVPGGAAISYIDNSQGQAKVVERPFAPGETVPPCATCELLVPFLLCADDDARCSHS